MVDIACVSIILICFEGYSTICWMVNPRIDSTSPERFATCGPGHSKKCSMYVNLPTKLGDVLD
jgi:hypothetical protein